MVRCDSLFVFPLSQYAKLSKLTHSSRISFDPDELRAMVAALHFIFHHSAQYDVDALGVLFGELQQLGLPRDICSVIVKTFQQSKEMIRNTLRKEVLSCQCKMQQRKRGPWHSACMRVTGLGLIQSVS